jgi:SAM-dependent methyltransferase
MLPADYWTQRYLNKDTGWDIGYVSTPIKEYVDQLTNKNISILIPGCGNAYEAAYLLEQGFNNVTVIDISEMLTTKLKERFYPHFNQQLRIVTGDFFKLNDKFDLIMEQTFLSALPPALRNDYAKHMQALLNPNGKLAGILFDHDFEKEGPPFGGNKKEYGDLFAKYFHIKTLEPCYNSIAARAGTECFFIVENTN